MARCHVVMLTLIEDQSFLDTGITNHNENLLNDFFVTLCYDRTT